MKRGFVIVKISEFILPLTIVYGKRFQVIP
jgi:hypothetical protein